jgi:hypothetical protein
MAICESSPAVMAYRGLVVFTILLAAAVHGAVTVTNDIPLPEPYRWVPVDLLSARLSTTYVAIAGSGCGFTHMPAMVGATHDMCRDSAERSGATMYGYTGSVVLSNCTMLTCASPLSSRTALVTDVAVAANTAVPLERIYVSPSQVNSVLEPWFCEHAGALCHGRSTRQYVDATSGLCKCACATGFSGDRCQRADYLGGDSGSLSLVVSSAPAAFQSRHLQQALPQTTAYLQSVILSTIGPRTLNRLWPGAVPADVRRLLSALPLIPACTLASFTTIAGTQQQASLVLCPVSDALPLPTARALRTDLAAALQLSAESGGLRSGLLAAIATDSGATTLVDSNGTNSRRNSIVGAQPKRVVRLFQPPAARRRLPARTDSSPGRYPSPRVDAHHPRCHRCRVCFDARRLVVIAKSAYACATLDQAVVASGRSRCVEAHRLDGRLSAGFAVTLMLILGSLTIAAAVSAYHSTSLVTLSGQVAATDARIMLLEYPSALSCAYSATFNTTPTRLAVISVLDGTCRQLNFETGAVNTESSPLFAAGWLDAASATVAKVVVSGTVAECSRRVADAEAVYTVSYPTLLRECHRVSATVAAGHISAFLLARQTSETFIANLADRTLIGRGLLASRTNRTTDEIVVADDGSLNGDVTKNVIAAFSSPTVYATVNVTQLPLLQKVRRNRKQVSVVLAASSDSASEADLLLAPAADDASSAPCQPWSSAALRVRQCSSHRWLLHQRRVRRHQCHVDAAFRATSRPRHGHAVGRCALD